MQMQKGPTVAQIDYFLAPMSPFTYLAGGRLEEIAARHGAAIRYIPLDAPKLFPRTGGQVLADRHEARKVYRLQDLRRQARKAGVPLMMQPPHFPVNPAPASYAIIAAQQAGGGDLAGLVQAFPRAVWAEGRNIADDEVVRALLSDHGFDPAVADRGMLAAADTYAANLEEAVARGVFGVPFYITGAVTGAVTGADTGADTGAYTGADTGSDTGAETGADERFWGQDRLEDLDLYLAGRL